MSLFFLQLIVFSNVYKRYKNQLMEAFSLLKI